MTNTVQTKKDFNITRVYNAPIAVVWSAITDKDAMKEWYFTLPDFKASVGFEFEFMGGPDKDRQYRHHCKVTEVVIEKKLAYSWRYDGYEGISFVTFELYEEGNNTRLTLTHTGLETFPSANTDFAAENFATGWNHIIGKSLKEYLER